MNWEKSNELESNYWDIFTAEMMTLKHQDLYMEFLDINSDYFTKGDNSLNFSNLKVLDVGGVPISVLLRTNNGKGNLHDEVLEGVIIDPAKINKYQLDRYSFFKLNFINDKAENIKKYYSEENFFDECLIYNCLQHAEEPLIILNSIFFISKRIRLSDPINAEIGDCHLRDFSEKYFDSFFTNEKFTIIKKQIISIGGVNHYTIVVDKK